MGAVVERGSFDDLEQQFAQSAADSDVPTQEGEFDIRELRFLLRTNAEIFITFFLAEQLDMPVPQFHSEIWSLLTDTQKERILLAIPRDHAKTTLAKLVVIWYWLFTPHRFCVYLSNTNAIAKGACKDIVAFLKCDNFVAAFGRVKVIKESENESLWIYDLTLSDGKIKRIILRAIGQGQQMRGINIDNQRPDIAVIDDVEDNENTESEKQQKKLDKWMFGPFLKALARRKKILWLGNMLQKTSLLARLSRSARWNPVVFGSLVKDAASGALRALWPDKWLADEERNQADSRELAVERIMEDFREYKESGQTETWMCEMMNMPGHGENGFSADMINYQAIPAPDNCRAAWITIDPAFGLNSWNDETAICVHVIPENGIPMTVACVHGQMDEMQMFNETISLARYWRAWVWGIEAVAAQKVLISLFNVLLAGRAMSGRVEMIPLMAGKGDPKLGRMKAFVALMANGEWAIPDADIDITQQILELDFRKKDQPDDRVDSCAYGPFMMEQFLPIIMAQNTGHDWATSLAQYGMEVSGV